MFNKEKLLRLVSLSVDDDKDSFTRPDSLSDLGLPLLFIQRFSPFVKILSSQNKYRDPLRVLTQIEKVFLYIV